MTDVDKLRDAIAWGKDERGRLYFPHRLDLLVKVAEESLAALPQTRTATIYVARFYRDSVRHGSLETEDMNTLTNAVCIAMEDGASVEIDAPVKREVPIK